ncbi:hypothetical protein AAFF_G00167980 [Aldrovandia affinis]|uniref:STAS domain-containing protein n=1 Tax=Aldrovandia affinis TaxID=143900 RepID=A0AAD7W7I0_9TELE|nr:hypothetical protein AAFF_G00167980 [Aldrovandia affinis]
MMRPSAARYTVSRPLYSEDAFAEDHEKVYRHHKTLLDHVKAYFTCDSKRAKNAALSLLPIIGWVRIYRIKEWLLGDVVSGVSTGLVAVLQGLAFSLLAGLDPIYGLYTAFFPVLVYCFLGTSRHISVVTRLVPEGGSNITGLEGLKIEEQRVVVAASLTFLMGIFQLAMGLLQMGFIVMYLSDTLVSGFTTAAAIHILVSQLKFVLGLTVPGLSGPLSIIYTLEVIFVQITDTNIADLVTSIVVMAIVFIAKELNDRYKAKLPVPIPIEIIVTIVVCGVSYGFNFKDKFDVDVVGIMQSGFETPLAPNMKVIEQSVAEAFPIAIVGFAVAFSVAKVYAIKHDYVIDGNQELIAFGVSNIIGATFRSFAASTALSRTAIQESTGGKTQSVLGALVIINLKGMLMQFREIPYLWRKDRPDCVVWIVTCIAAILLGLDLGLAVGVGVELLTVVFRTQFPRCCVLANITGTEIYRDHKDYFCIYEPEGVKIFRIPSPIFFANIEFFRGKLVESVGFNPLRILRKKNKALRKIKKLLKNGQLQITEKGLVNTGSAPIESEDESNMEDLDKPINFQDLPVQVNWNAELPANICVPKVDVHSVILDFAAVSFLDISALKGLKMALKEFIRVDVEVYIVACDVYILEKLHSCKFFDDEIKTSIFFLTLHDAMLHILEKHPDQSEAKDTYEKAPRHGHLDVHSNGLRNRDKRDSYHFPWVLHEGSGWDGVSRDQKS